MKCCEKCCEYCSYPDGYIGPKTRLLFYLDMENKLPDELSPEEIWILVDLTMSGRFGNGRERKRKLGKWYRIVQTIVNRSLDLERRRGF